MCFNRVYSARCGAIAVKAALNSATKSDPCLAARFQQERKQMNLDLGDTRLMHVSKKKKKGAKFISLHEGNPLTAYL